MKKSMNDILCNPVGTSSQQSAINEEEWRKPENWHGNIFPGYSSKLDTRPFVRGRMFPPKSMDDTRWAGVLTSQITNRGHPRGWVWSILARVTVVGIVIIWIVAVVLSSSQ